MATTRIIFAFFRVSHYTLPYGELSLLELFFADTKVLLLSFVIDFSVAVSSSDAVA